MLFWNSWPRHANTHYCRCKDTTHTDNNNTGSFRACSARQWNTKRRMGGSAVGGGGGAIGCFYGPSWTNTEVCSINICFVFILQFFFVCVLRIPALHYCFRRETIPLHISLSVHPSDMTVGSLSANRFLQHLFSWINISPNS